MKKGGAGKFRARESIREIVFGIEDSVVSTLGTITGMAAGTGSSYIVILSGLVLIFVEALSMSAGSFLSSKSSRQAKIEGRAKSSASPVRDGVVMGIFYLIGGCVPLIPYFLLPVEGALLIAVVLSAVTLFFLGVWKGRVVKIKPLLSGLEMMSVSLVAAALGYGVGRLAAYLFDLAGLAI